MDDNGYIGKDSRHIKLPRTQKKGKPASEVGELHEETREQTREDTRRSEAAMERAV